MHSALRWCIVLFFCSRDCLNEAASVIWTFEVAATWSTASESVATAIVEDVVTNQFQPTNTEMNVLVSWRCLLAGGRMNYNLVVDSSEIVLRVLKKHQPGGIKSTIQHMHTRNAKQKAALRIVFKPVASQMYYDDRVVAVVTVQEEETPLRVILYDFSIWPTKILLVPLDIRRRRDPNDPNDAYMSDNSDDDDKVDTETEAQDGGGSWRDEILTDDLNTQHQGANNHEAFDYEENGKALEEALRQKGNAGVINPQKGIVNPGQLQRDKERRRRHILRRLTEDPNKRKKKNDLDGRDQRMIALSESIQQSEQTVPDAVVTFMHPDCFYMRNSIRNIMQHVETEQSNVKDLVGLLDPYHWKTHSVASLHEAHYELYYDYIEFDDLPQSDRIDYTEVVQRICTKPNKLVDTILSFRSGYTDDDLDPRLQTSIVWVILPAAHFKHLNRAYVDGGEADPNQIDVVQFATLFKTTWNLGAMDGDATYDSIALDQELLWRSHINYLDPCSPEDYVMRRYKGKMFKVTKPKFRHPRRFGDTPTEGDYWTYGTPNKYKSIMGIKCAYRYIEGNRQIYPLSPRLSPRFPTSPNPFAGFSTSERTAFLHEVASMFSPDEFEETCKRIEHKPSYSYPPSLILHGTNNLHKQKKRTKKRSPKNQNENHTLQGITVNTRTHQPSIRDNQNDVTVSTDLSKRNALKKLKNRPSKVKRNKGSLLSDGTVRTSYTHEKTRKLAKKEDGNLHHPTGTNSRTVSAADNKKTPLDNENYNLGVAGGIKPRRGARRGNQQAYTVPQTDTTYNERNRVQAPK